MPPPSVAGASPGTATGTVTGAVGRIPVPVPDPDPDSGPGPRPGPGFRSPYPSRSPVPVPESGPCFGSGCSRHGLPPDRSEEPDGRRGLRCQGSLRAPCGGRRGRSEIVSTRVPFQSAPPCGGRRRRRRLHRGGDTFQSAPPCGGRRGRAAAQAHGHRVSIRAPVRGATGGPRPHGGRRGFQSAPPCGGRPSSASPPRRRRERFNPRPRAGGDSSRCARRRDARTVSIRAPVRGATRAARPSGALELFQSAPPCGGRLGSCSHALAWRCFNPRPRAGGDARGIDDAAHRRSVSIRAPVRGATAVAELASVTDGFQSAPPCGGRPRAAARMRARPVRFNPRPRAGGDAAGARLVAAGAVSIRAPVRGATRRGRPCAVGTSFNPRPRAGGDARSAPRRHRQYVFQSAPPCGGRRRPGRRRCQRRRDESVSIRAPVRGATSDRPASVRRRTRDVECFNPRPRAGGDVGRRASHCAGFNPRPVRGATDQLGGGCRRRFNPRPRAGGDDAASTQRRCARRFNPRPRAGGDTCAARARRPAAAFQSAPPCGGRPTPRRRPCDASSCFNPRPRAGGDARGTCRARRRRWFQSAPPCGGRRRRSAVDVPPERVSIRAPVRGATRSARCRRSSTLVFQSAPPCGGRRAPGVRTHCVA